MNKLALIRSIAFMAIACFFQLEAQSQSKQMPVLVKFLHTASGKQVVLQDSAYQNAFGEAYQLTRLKYYISNLSLQGKQPGQTVPSVYLIDAANEDSIVLNLKAGTYQSLSFTLGVDSIYNCSGAQDGALDPLNGMFWSWNSGYVFFKMEGYSASSTADLQRIEHHIGGYLGTHKASVNIMLPLEKPLLIDDHKKQMIEVTMDLDKYWKGKNDLTIASNALIMTPGPLALKSAENFAGMFSVRVVQ